MKLHAMCALLALGLFACTTTPATPDSTDEMTEGTKTKGLEGKKAADTKMEGAKKAALEDVTARAAAAQIWGRLGETENSCVRVFDYFPDGGLLIAACHLASVSEEAGGSLELGAFEALQRLSPVPVFVSGPHNDAFIVGEQATQDDFGHYNPAFVEWFVANAIPAEDDAELLAATRPLYQAKLRATAEIFEVTYQHARANEECFIRERDLYMDAIRSGNSQYYYERFYAYLSPDFCGNPEADNWNSMPQEYDGNVVKSAAAFWMRRSVDGTMEQWHLGLEKLMTVYR